MRNLFIAALVIAAILGYALLHKHSFVWFLLAGTAIFAVFLGPAIAHYCHHLRRGDGHWTALSIACHKAGMQPFRFLLAPITAVLYVCIMGHHPDRLYL